MKLRHALAQGANPNFFNQKKEGVLHVASRNASTEAALCAKELIIRGARVSDAVISSRNTPIHEAASSGAKEVSSLLIEAFPDCTNLENCFGNTALHAAARAGNPDIVKLLLSNSSDPNKANHRGSTALHVVASLATGTFAADPYIQIAAMLLCHDKLIIDIQDVNGYAALHVASQNGCKDMVKLLIDSGASLNIKTGIDSKGRGGRTAEEMAKFGGHASTAAMIHELSEAISRGEDIATKKMARKLLEQL